MPDAEIERGKIYYTRCKGPEDVPPMILIHGAGGSRLHWPGELRRLPTTTVYTIDLPGHGRSEGQGCERITDYAQAARAFLDAVGIERAVVAGHSMGGAIAMTLALHCADRVAGLALVGAGARLRVSPRILKMIRDDFAESVDLITRFAWSPEAQPALVEIGRKSLRKTDPGVVLGDFIACDHFDVMDRLGEIAAPTLVITGVDDQMTPVKYAHFLTESIPGAEQVILDGAGHMVMLERAKAVARAIREFLERRIPK